MEKKHKNVKKYVHVFAMNYSYKYQTPTHWKAYIYHESIADGYPCSWMTKAIFHAVNLFISKGI